MDLYYSVTISDAAAFLDESLCPSDEGALARANWSPLRCFGSAQPKHLFIDTGNLVIEDAVQAFNQSVRKILETYCHIAACKLIIVRAEQCQI